jgi:hypothetical protein
MDRPLAIITHPTPPASTLESEPAAVTLGMLDISDRVGRSPLIVRCRLAHWNSPLAQYNISDVIFGDYPDKTITLDLSGELDAMMHSARYQLKQQTGKEPTDAEVMAEAKNSLGVDMGRDLILELRPIPNGPGHADGMKYIRTGQSFDVPPQHRLDDVEDEMIKVIADGSAFEPHVQPGDVLRENIADAQLIVRATLVQIDAGESKWKIARILKGNAKTDVLILNNQFFRSRAKAIVAHTARRQSHLTNSPITATEVPDFAVNMEIDHLIKGELTPAKDAILFVDQVKVNIDAIHGRLRHRAYEDNQKPKLDALERAIGHPDPSINL